MVDENTENSLMPKHFLPDFCQLGAVIYIVLLAQILALVLALGQLANGRDFWSELSWYSIFIFWVALVSAAILCGLRPRMRGWSDIQAGCSAFGLIILITALMSALVLEILPRYDLIWPAAGELKSGLYLRNLAISAIISGVILRYLYVQQQWRRQTQARLEAKLDALQARMRPHFLFNSLNTIACLARENPALCESLVEDLAELFRASIKTTGRMVPLAQELALVEKYLNIEQNRLGDRLQLVWDLQQVPKDALLPPLTLQPLIENAVYHGIETCVGPAQLVVRGGMQHGKLWLTITNPMAESAQQKHRTGNRLALETLRARINGCFPDEGQLLATVVDGEYQMRLIIPYRKRQS